MKLLYCTLIVCCVQVKAFAQLQLPVNAACTITSNTSTGKFELRYEGSVIANMQAGKQVSITEHVSINDSTKALTQIFTLVMNRQRLAGTIAASGQAILAETRSVAQEKFPIVRTTIGTGSENLRNNAVYDRYNDWSLEFSTVHGQQRIRPGFTTATGNQYRFEASGDTVRIVFRPLYYQKHKGIQYFNPRSYRVWKQPVTGWSSWWAYFRKFNEQNLNELLDVWKSKHLADYGYRYIQIDDGYQGGEDAGHRAPKETPHGYYATGPGTWLHWKKDLFPGGIDGYVRAVKKAGFTPGVWMGSFYTSMDSVERHPGWFIQDSTGHASLAHWVSYAINAKNKEAAEVLIRPSFRGWKQAGMQYLKIDQLRHYVFDNMNNHLDFFRNKGYSPDDVFRRYLRIAREELGPQTFILSCWGVLPQSVGLADACRIGGDGYGPVTMQQYNSWNGIVWINDPDHCDILPDYKPATTGDVKEVTATSSELSETKLRPALASIAGCMLMLSDKPAVYANDANLEGVKRASPVLFSVPGQLYDYDEVKSKRLPGLDLSTLRSGTDPTIIDADQFGTVCPWWLNEINRPFEHWNVLSRMNWTKETMPSATVAFADLGLDSNKTYLVFEFWDKQFIGSATRTFTASALSPNTIHTYAIRESANHPQVISTNRHLTQGGYDLQNVSWKQPVLSGESEVVAGDPYEIYVHLPEGYGIRQAIAGRTHLQVTVKERYAILRFVPVTTRRIPWKIIFSKK